ncbi:hypothetical protein B566_EDAN007806 [Ephemera danica]|nr:hypothetical protein B566_EDAN007806 [Ephemera danica]
MICLGKLLYDNYLLDVPTMLDLCLLYGHGNTAKSLAKSLNFVLHMQPKFIGDFESAAQMLARALKELEAYFVLQPSGSKASKGPPLSNQAPGSKEEMSARQLEDLVLFLLDLVSSVSTLLQLVPSACTALQNTLIEAEIARFYELVIPELYNKVLSVPDDAQCNDLQKKVDTARDNSTAAAMAEEYIAVLSECLAEPHFIRDYHVLSPINQDLEILQQKCPEQFCFDVPQRSQQQELSKSRPQQSSKPPAQSEPSTSKSNGYAEDNAEALVLESLVSEIQSILPDLGAGFVQQCLKHFKFNKEDVINAILEESLPTELQGLDRTMALPSQNTSRVYRGKKRSKHKNLTQLLEDKEDIKGLRDFYSRYGSVQDVVYDDEYDDTYDEINDISVDDPDPLTERRPFVMPRVLAAQQAAVEDNNVDCEEEEEEEENARALPPRDREAFVQDPALLREQAEQRRASKMAQQHRPRPPPKDVVGNSKGQGQDSNVLLNRQRKNTHKSSQGNHNRRAGAQRKMRQGMVPS